MFTFSVAQCGMICWLCSVAVISQVLGCASGHRSCSVHLVTQPQIICQKQPAPIRASGGPPDTDYSDSSCQALPATACLFWSLPLQHSDSERWGTMWPGRRWAMESSSTCSSSGSQLGARAHRPQLQVGAPCRGWERANSWGTFGRLANCRPKSVTLGDGGIKACWLVFTGGLNWHSVPPERTVPETPWSWLGGLGHIKGVLCGLLGQTTWPAPLKQALLCP